MLARNSISIKLVIALHCHCISIKWRFFQRFVLFRSIYNTWCTLRHVFSFAPLCNSSTELMYFHTFMSHRIGRVNLLFIYISMYTYISLLSLSVSEQLNTKISEGHNNGISKNWISKTKQNQLSVRVTFNRHVEQRTGHAGSVATFLSMSKRVRISGE